MSVQYLVEHRNCWLNPEYTKPLGVFFSEEQVMRAENTNGVLGVFCGITCVVSSPCPIERSAQSIKRRGFFSHPYHHGLA